MHVFINSAMSADGKISNVRREQVRISGAGDFERVDSLRAESDAIGVGVGTVLADDPSLTVKDEGENPLRVVFDSGARTPEDSEVFEGESDTVVFVGRRADDEDVDRLRRRADVVRTYGDSDRVDLGEAVETLEERGVESLMVEGGGGINYSFLSEKLVDEILVYVGASVIGGTDAPTVVDGDGFVDKYPRLELGSVERIDEGVLLRWTVDKESY
ncbi:MAG: 2,5-diamino-6-(ribosylamino)-4(3H)-pyrimidinone 5'-phosphate reductase [Halobacteria archaeon]|nr:2,5-diamino-6-(ribosylamino)-4(3H)-pyrimidinone 5'-phosphate reductase [Halobacteria archaeon]